MSSITSYSGSSNNTSDSSVTVSVVLHETNTKTNVKKRMKTIVLSFKSELFINIKTFLARNLLQKKKSDFNLYRQYSQAMQVLQILHFLYP